MKSLSKSVLGIPYAIFLLVFVVCPVMILLYYGFTNGQGQFTMANFYLFFTDTKTIGTMIYSAIIAAVTTTVCLVLAYPIAYILARGGYKKKNVLVLLFVMPMWINFTLRITALKEILTAAEGNLAFYPFLNTIIGMTYDFLPFMILPIYNTINKIDESYIEAAADLGAKSYRIFLKIILPLSIPGIVSGITMVLLPAMTNYVVLDMLYNSTYIMGSLIGSYFNMYSWSNGSVISVILLLFILIMNIITGAFSKKEGD